MLLVVSKGTKSKAAAFSFLSTQLPVSVILAQPLESVGE